jgi:(1->4)-alpha-D-glucan 1-alpha-D-glucosylmutase
MPSEWKDHLQQWANQNAQHKEQISGHAVPDRNEEYFLYQTLLGVWPLDQQGCEGLVERVQAHIVKATREAMVHTRWTRPNQAHEDALVKFVSRILSSQDSTEFLQDFRQFQKRLAYLGMINGLSQTLLKIVAPGVPDFYQGSELWDLRLVDPDNRGPIDFNKRAAALDSLSNLDDAHDVRSLVENWRDGRAKMYLIWKALRFRRDHQDLFREGEFVPLQSVGTYSRNVTAFLRRRGMSWVIAAVPRWLSQVRTPDDRTPADRKKAAFNWEDTRLLLPPESPSSWKDVLAGKQLSSQGDRDAHLAVNDLFSGFPVALISSGL